MGAPQPGARALQPGDLPAATARFEESLELRRRSGPSGDVAGGLAGLASAALRKGALDEAVRLFGAVDSMLESTHSMLPPADELVRRTDLARLAPSPSGGGQGAGRN